MSRLPDDPALPLDIESPDYLTDLNRRLTELFIEISSQVNAMSEERMESRLLARSASPTGIVLQVGDIIHNKVPTETGSAGSRYVIVGWQAITDGTASASSVVELRSLTGN